MQTRSKLALLELISGLCGWIWILASIAAVFFFVAALAFGGRWSSLFWSLGAGAIAKWLAGGFNDHQKRVEYETDLVARGLSPEQAREAWLNAYTGSGAQAAPSERGRSMASCDAVEEALLEAEELVNKYGAVLGQSKTITNSEAALPAPKDKIKDALVALARHAKASGAPPEAIQPLRFGYASLADFVSGHGTHAAINFDNLAGDGAAELGDSEIRELAHKIGSVGPSALDVKRRSTEEFTHLTAEFDERVRA